MWSLWTISLVLLVARTFGSSDLCGRWSPSNWSSTSRLGCTQNGQSCAKLNPSYPLSSSDFDRAWFSRGDTSLLDAFLRDLANGCTSSQSENMTVVVLGGSETAGHGTSNTTMRWSSVLERWLLRTYPAARVSVKNLAMPSSSTSDALAVQIPRLWSQHENVRLVIVEYGVNDAHVSDVAVVSATEKLVDAVLKHVPDPPALLYFELFRIGGSPSDTRHHCMDDGHGVVNDRVCTKFFHVQDVHARITVPRRVPVVSYRDVVWQDLSQPLWGGRQKFHPLWAGVVHPNDVTHQIVADVLTKALQERANELCENKASIKKPAASLTPLAWCDMLHGKAGDPALGVRAEDLRRAWFHDPLVGIWAARLDAALAAMLGPNEPARPLRVAVVLGDDSNWPELLAAWLDSVGAGRVSLVYLAAPGGAHGLAAAPTVGEPFDSTVAFAAALNNTSLDFLNSVDLVLVDLASADGRKAGLLERDVTTATRSIVAALARTELALVFVETYYAADSAESCANMCAGKQPGRVVMRADLRLCSSFYFAQDAHCAALVPLAVPVVSVRDVAWPLLGEVPAPLSGQMQAERTALVVSRALSRRGRAALGCACDEKNHFLELFASEEQDADLCAADAALTVVSAQLGNLQRAASTAHLGWRFYEDASGRGAGWIYEQPDAAQAKGQNNMDALLALRLNVRIAEPRIHVSFLKTYSCVGKARAWVGLVDPWAATAPANASKCGVELDAHWDQKLSLPQVANFHPPPECFHGAQIAREKGGVIAATLYLRPAPTRALPHCQPAPTKFKLVYISTC